MIADLHSGRTLLHQGTKYQRENKIMEISQVQEYLNNKVLALVKQVKKCEEERNATLVDLITFENTAINSGSEFDRHFAEICKNLRKVVENLVVAVNIDKGERTRSGDETENIKKCRYFNRGYCKFGEKCMYYHASEICQVYAEEGTCLKHRCIKRHPKKCRYWSKHPEGCRFGERCKYLHVTVEKYTVDDEDEDFTGNCDDCEVNLGHDQENASLKTHRMASHLSSVGLGGRITSCDQCEDSCRCENNHRGHINAKDKNWEITEEVARISNKYENDTNITKERQEDQEGIGQRYEARGRVKFLTN